MCPVKLKSGPCRKYNDLRVRGCFASQVLMMPAWLASQSERSQYSRIWGQILRLAKEAVSRTLRPQETGWLALQPPSGTPSPNHIPMR